MMGLSKLAMLGLTMLLVTDMAAVAQHIAPHSNDPHPPANQPAYQLPSPLHRPGVPGYPGAAHSNDPHYRKTVPQPVWPQTAPVPRAQPMPARPLPYSSLPYTSGKPRKERAMKPARDLAECIGRWTPQKPISKGEWEAACRRLEVSGRVRTE